jgi:hypothetical protein
MSAAHAFKALNGLKDLPNDEYTHVVLLAFLLSRNTDKTLGDFRKLHPRSNHELSCVLVDRAQRDAAAGGNAPLKVPVNGRYELGRHHLLMQRLIVDGIAFPDASWSAFEMLTSDAMLQVVRMIGDEDLRKAAREIDPNVDGKASGWARGVKPKASKQWVGEIAMIKWMADKVHEVCRDNKLDVPNLAVCRSFAKIRVAQGQNKHDKDKTSLESFLNLFPGRDEQGVQCHHVVLNGNIAPGPDVMVGVRLSNGKFAFFFVQCKCYAGTKLTSDDVANELPKLGMSKKAKGSTSQSGNKNLTDRLHENGHYVYGTLIVRDRATKPGDVLFPGTEHPDMLYVTSPHEENPRPTKQWFLDRGESHFTTTFEPACCRGNKCSNAPK